MPAYITNPSQNSAIPLLQPGLPGYSLGSRATGSTRLLQVTNVALTGNVATLNVTMREGNIPAIGDLITVRGTSGAAGAFNVTNVALTGVSINSLTGQGTVTFALTHADVGSAVDAGQAYIPVPETAETLQVQKCLQFALPELSSENANSRTISWSTSYPSAPVSVSVTLEAALQDIDSQYATLDTSTNVNGETRLITLTDFRFVRINFGAVTGGSSPTGIAKILI